MKKPFSILLLLVTTANFNSFSQTQANSDYSPGNDCYKKFEIGGGPSLLSREFGMDNKTLFGAHFNTNYNITSKIGVGADVSTYSGKIGSTSLRNTFVMIDGEYVFGKGMDNCEKRVFIEARVLLGYGVEVYGSSKGSGPLYGAGMGGIIRINPKLDLEGIVDYLAIKYDDDWNSNVRATVQVRYKF